MNLSLLNEVKYPRKIGDDLLSEVIPAIGTTDERVIEYLLYGKFAVSVMIVNHDAVAALGYAINSRTPLRYVAAGGSLPISNMPIQYVRIVPNVVTGDWEVSAQCVKAEELIR